MRLRNTRKREASGARPATRRWENVGVSLLQSSSSVRSVMRIELSFLSGAQQPAPPARSYGKEQGCIRLGQAGRLSFTLLDLHPEDAKDLLISPTNVSNDYHQLSL